MEILHDSPPEIFDAVIKSLIVTIGIVKALRLRVVNRRFDYAISFEVFVRQVVSIYDPAIRSL